MAREDDLLRRFRIDGDSAAMEDLVAATRPRLCAVARRIGAPQDAEDSVQAAYHALLRRADASDGASVVGWLVIAVVRIAYRRKAATRRDAALAERLARPRGVSGPAEHAIRGEEDALVRDAVHRLPAHYRDAVVLHHLEGLPLADAARLLDVPEATAKTRVQRGRALLRMRLAAHLAYGLVIIPWALADGARGLAVHGPAIGGAMNTKVAVAALVVVAFGLGTAVGVGASQGTSPVEASDATPRATPGSSVPANAPPPRSSEARSAEAGETAVRAERSRRAEQGPSFTLDDVRRVVAEELARRDQEESEPPAPPAANPELNADPSRRSEVTEALAGARRAFIEYDLRYELGPGHVATQPDPVRLESYPDPSSWPGNILGWVEKRPERYEVLDAAATGFHAVRERGAFAFSAPLARAIVAQSSQALLFLAGISPTGIVTVQTGGVLHCVGDMQGKLDLDGYTTTVVEGDLTGSVVTKSYTNTLVRGALTGAFKTESYANVYVLGGFTGTMDLYDSAAVYFGGYVPQTAFDRIKMSGRTTFVFEATDLPPGKHSGRGGAAITVLAPR